MASAWTKAAAGGGDFGDGWVPLPATAWVEPDAPAGDAALDEAATTFGRGAGSALEVGLDVPDHPDS